jgi:hypothetical protein
MTKNNCDMDYLHLVKVIKEDVWLPEQIFNSSFYSYFFFDADKCTSIDLARALSKIVKQSFGLDRKVIVLSSKDRTYLGCFDANESWEHELSIFSKKLKEEDDYSGLILFDSSSSWIFYQKVPGELRILALNCSDDMKEVMPKFSDCFLILNDIEHSFELSSKRDLDFQQDFLASLVKNYTVI